MALENIPVKKIGDPFLFAEMNEMVDQIRKNAEDIKGAVSGYQGDIAPTDNFVPSERPKGYYNPTVLGASYGPTGNKYLEVPENPDGEGDRYIYQVINNGVTISLAKTIVPTGDFATKVELANKLDTSEFNTLLTAGSSEQIDILTGVTTTTASIRNDGSVVDQASDWKTTAYIPVSFGDVITYTGKTSFGTNVVRAVYGYSSSNSPVALLLGIIEAGNPTSFQITNVAITKIRVCSYQPETYPWSLTKSISNKVVKKDKVEQLPELITKVNDVDQNIKTLVTYSTTENNVLSGVNTTIASLRQDGSVVSQAQDWYTTDFISVSFGDNYIYNGRTASGSNIVRAVFGYASNNTPIGVLVGVVAANNPVSFTINNASISKIRVCCYQPNIHPWSLIKVGVSENSIVKETKVEGVPSLSVVRTILDKGVNVDYALKSGLIVGTRLPTGEIDPTKLSWRTTQFIPVSFGDVVQYQGIAVTIAGKEVAVLGIKTDYTFIVLRATSSSSSLASISIPDGVFAVSAVFRAESGDVFKFLAPSQNLNNLVYDGIKKPILGVMANIGDSITNRDGNPWPGETVPVKGYQAYINDVFQFTEGRVKYAYSGWSLASIDSSDTEAIVRQRNAWTSQAALFTCLVGTNDFSKGVQIGTPDDYINNTYTNANPTFYGAYRMIIDRMYTLNPNCFILLITPPQRNSAGGSSFVPNSIGKYLSDYVDAIRWVAERNSLPCVDLFRYGGINLNNIAVWSNDNLHPNELGHKLISRPMINELFKYLI